VLRMYLRAWLWLECWLCHRGRGPVGVGVDGHGVEAGRHPSMEAKAGEALRGLLLGAPLLLAMGVWVGVAGAGR